MRVAADVRRLLLQCFRIPAFALFCAVWVVSAASGASPALEMLFPAGAPRGTTNTVVAVGKFDSWPAKVWVNHPGVLLVAETNKGKFTVTIAADAAPGPCLVRLYDDEGASEPRIFVVDAERALAEIEPNDHFAKPQPISRLPVTIDGRLEKNGDVDSFAIRLRAGEWIEARVDSHRLMSKVDPALRLLTTNGLQLAWNQDFITLDPRLVWQAPSNQTVVLQVFGFAYPPESSIRLAGGDAAVYRLHIAITNHSPEVCSIPDEREPNERPDQSVPVEVPVEIRGHIRRADDEDRFRFSAIKVEVIEALVEAATLGSPLDAWLKIEDHSGKELARNDDVDGSPDPRIEWTVPTNGSFIVAIGSVTHRGGTNYCYRLSLRKLGPDFRATLAASTLVLTAGATNEVKLEAGRLRGLTNELAVIVQGLPAGVSAVATNLPRKDGTISVSLVAEPDAAGFQGPVQFMARDESNGQKRTVPFELTTRSDTGYPHLLVETCGDFWLTVRPKPTASEKPATGK